jgi:dienelactone hydrolase
MLCLLPSLDLHAAEIETEVVRLPAVINDKTFRLEAFIARPEGKGPFPVALMTHGSAGQTTKPEDLRAERVMGNWPLDFAARGYMAVVVMRRGYGLSDGDVNRSGGNCGEPVPGRFMQRDADDLEAALKVIATRPEADMSRVIGIGQSLGGADMLALSARPSVRLSAVISVSGGIYHYDKGDTPRPFHAYDKCPAFRAALVSAFGSYGEKARMPHLWAYEENDPWFRPDLVEDMQKAWKKGGGDVRAEILSAGLINGHELFFAPEGRAVLSPLFDDFLRAHNLPTWDTAPVEALRKRLAAGQQAELDKYLKDGISQRALAVATDGSGKLYAEQGQGIVDRARRRAIAACQQDQKKPCRLLMSNFDLMPQ